MIQLLLFYMVRYLFYTIGDLTYQSPLVSSSSGYENESIGRRISKSQKETHYCFWNKHLLDGGSRSKEALIPV